MSNQPEPLYQLRQPITRDKGYDEEDNEGWNIYIDGTSDASAFIYRENFNELFVPVDEVEVTRQLETMLEILSETFFSAGLERARMTSSAEMVAQGEQLKESFQAMLAEIRAFTQGETKE